MKISSRRFAVRSSLNTEVPLPKCVAWNSSVSVNSKYLMAVGQQNGKVTLTSFRTLDEHEHALHSCEFNPKASRPCLALQWSSDYPNLLAEGLDRSKGEASLLVWDTNHFSDFNAKHLFSSQITRDTLSCVSRPLTEFGMVSEPILSLDWLSGKCLVCSSRQHLRVYDLREEDSKQAQLELFTKAVYCARVDPHNEQRIASFFEGTIHVYDRRRFDKPMVIIERPCTYSKLAWCPTRFSCIAALVKDSSVIRLFDVQQNEFDLMAVEDDMPPPVLERTVHCEEKHIHSFSWIKSQANRLLVIGNQGDVRDIAVHERIPLAWSADSQLSWGSGPDLFNHYCQEVDSHSHTDDIAELMRRRAIQGYGIDIAKNLNIVKDNPELKGLWNWMDYMMKLKNQGKLKPLVGHSQSHYPGVYSVICDKTDDSKANETKYPLPEDLCNIWQHQSPERERAMLLCGWNFDGSESTLDDFVKRLEMNDYYERAAAICLLHGHIRRAVSTLLSGASASRKDKVRSSTLSLVSMALAGYSNNKSLWHEICRQHKDEIQNPYLVAAFAFLTSDGQDFESVLQPRNGPGLQINDSVASACMFLDKTQLHAHLGRVTKAMCDKGSLDGILLTGLSKLGLELLQKYVEKTGDVQTACLAVCHAGDTQLTNDSRFIAWMEAYGCLLDMWQLWKERAELDVERLMLTAATKPSQQVFVTCTFCGKSVSTETAASSDSHRTRPSMMPQSATMSGQTKPRITSCPGCRKPLPRCSVCLLNLGTASSPVRLHPSSSNQPPKSTKRASFDSWFTWCQTCRHGGHASHLVEWFRDHTECAVTSCSCRCMSLDSTAHHIAASS
ncbi:GATOR2 complex protein MIOS-B-like isoform X2 [Corticium candelabrum]|nr:GATOR2 complex protein MIOS-B-like isoform X2 [Corticium candelabrum]